MGEKETATAEDLSRTGNLLNLDDERPEARASNLNLSKSNREQAGGNEAGDAARAAVKGSKSNTSERATSLKGSKSNSSERMAEGPDDPMEATTVKSGKSNSSERVQGGASGVTEATTVKSSKSNSSE